MNSRRDKYEYVSGDDQKLNALFNSINKDGTQELQELLEQKVDSRSITNSLQYAARLSRWTCSHLLIEYSRKQEYYHSSDFMRNMGEVLLLAAKENQTAVVKGIFELINLQRKVNKDIVDPGLLYCNSLRPKLKRDDKQAYTSLHWAVHHNNAELCELFAYFTKSPGVYFTHYGADAPIYRAKDKLGQTAFELAISLRYTECARKIALGMSYEYLVHRAKDDVVRAVSLKNIPLYFPYSGALDPDRSPKKKHYDSVKKMLFQHILELPDNEKRQASDLMIRKGTALHALFNRGSSSKSEKYINQLIENIHKEETGIKAPLISSTSKLLKRLRPYEEESLAILGLEDNTKPSVVVRITDKKDRPRTWVVYEDISSGSSEEAQYTSRCARR